jgi:hypothetical protein
MNMFGRPRGIMGRLGGAIMARMNKDCGVWVAGLSLNRLVQASASKVSSFMQRDARRISALMESDFQVSVNYNITV